MRAVTLKVKNILGFEEYELAFGTITRIQGENGTGKTSLIGGLLGLFEKGHDATLLRAGADKGEAVVVFEEGDGSTTTLSNAVTAEESKRKAKNSKMGTISAPTYIKRVADLLALNPIDFLRLKDKDKLEWLLKFCLLELSDADLKAAAGEYAVPTKGRDALSVLAQVRKAIYDARTGVNRVAEDKERTVRELSGTLAEDDGANWPSVLKEQHEKYAQVLKEIAGVTNTAEGLLATERDIIRDSFAARKQKLEVEAQLQIDAIKTKLASDIEGLNAQKEKDLEEIRQAAIIKTKQACAPLEKRREALASDIAKAEEKVEAQHRAQTTRQIIDRTKAEAEEKKAESQRLTAALDRVDALKLKLVAELPIPGGSVTDDGNLLVDGVALGRINTARALGISLNVACRRAESLDCKLICLDDAEHLDRKSFAALEKACRSLAEDGYQFIISRVANPPADWPADKPYFEVQAE